MVSSYEVGDILVSIPSRGSGKGDTASSSGPNVITGSFQSPLGEVVKETCVYKLW